MLEGCNMMCGFKRQYLSSARYVRRTHKKRERERGLYIQNRDNKKLIKILDLRVGYGG